MKIIAILIPLFLLALAPRASAQCAAQSLSLKPGWNAVYVEVSPEEGAEAVFSAWPVDSVGVYDPAGFLATRQFSRTGGTEGLVSSPILMWNRDYPEATAVERIPAGSVCLCFNTNLAGGTFRTTLVGVPAAPRTTWHRSEGGDVLNYFGFSLQDGAKVAPADFLAGFDALAGGSLLRIGGKTRGDPPSRLPLYASETVGDGEVLLVGSMDVSDWSGALFVSPMLGLDFGTEASRATISVRNDGGAPRTVALKLRDAVAQLDPRIAFSPAFLRWRDEDVALTNAAWNEVAGYGEVARKRLGVGETWRVAFGLVRTHAAFAGIPRGTPFGALLEATDEDGGTKMKAVVPLRAETTGTDAAATAWPAGLWVAEVAFDHILAPGATAETETGGTAKIRLPVHLDEHGAVRLLQRVVAAGTADSEGKWTYRLYAGCAAVPTTASEAMRISAVTLPTETPVIEAESGASFASGGVAFAFTVAGDGATSLLRHPLHPQHDGLCWDFSTPAPSGDDFQNYRGDVKPETFSVACRIEMSLETNGGEAAWNPENAKVGTCRWTFSNLMRQGDIVLSGPMTLKRVSPLAEIVLE